MQARAKENLLAFCRAQPDLLKGNASEGKESLLAVCRAQPDLLKGNASEGKRELARSLPSAA